MALSITNESKNSLSITNESKQTGGTIDSATVSLDSVTTPIDYPGLFITPETKNTLNITNESKS